MEMGAREEVNHRYGRLGPVAYSGVCNMLSPAISSGHINRVNYKIKMVRCIRRTGKVMFWYL